MISAYDIYTCIDSLAPFSTAMDFDNSGLLVGDAAKEVHKVLLTLDITEEAIERACSLGADMIISHHPVIFSPLKRLESGSIPYKLAAAEITAICAHTNLDMAKKGVNCALAEKLGLLRIHGIAEETPGAFIVWQGELTEEMEPETFARYVKERLHCEAVELAAGKSKIHTVALCSGSGADFMSMAPEADAFVTGEAKHHEWLEAKASGKTLVVAGHYSTEVVVLEPLAELLRSAFPEVEFSVFRGEPPMRFVF